MKQQVVEIGFLIESSEDYEFLETLLTKIGIPYYVEPQRNPPFASLEDLECQCEGK